MRSASPSRLIMQKTRQNESYRARPDGKERVMSTHVHGLTVAHLADASFTARSIDRAVTLVDDVSRAIIVVDQRGRVVVRPEERTR